MAISKKQVLIIDNATTCAMRIKTLINIHGASAKVIHWSDWPYYRQIDNGNAPCLVIIEETVPGTIVEEVIENYPAPPFFLLINKTTEHKNWQFNKPINPVLSTLSNFELVALLEPYWSEDKVINLPSVLILDNVPALSFLLSEGLTQANIPCRVTDSIDATYLKNVDMVLVNVNELDKRKPQLNKLLTANSSVGVIAYGDDDSLTDLNFVQYALEKRLDMAVTLDQIQGNWIGEFYRVWREKAEFKDKQLVAKQVEESLATLLEKSLVMQVLFANSMDGVVSFTEEGRILKFNSGFCELIGVLQEQLVGANLYSWLPMQSRHDLEKLLIEERLLQQQVLDLEVRHEHKVNIPVSVAINKINFHGKFVFVAVMRNNTSQQLQQKLLVQKNAQLIHQAKKLKQQQQIHSELLRKSERKKQSFMLSFTEYLSQLSETELALAQYKISNVQQYYRILSKQEHCEAKPLMLAHILDNLISNQSTEIDNAGIKVRQRVNKSQQIVFDQLHLKKIISELLTNAIQFSLKSSVLEFTCIPVSEQFVELYITDTGIGILEHRQVQLFDLYELNSESNKSLATGLPLVKALAQLNGGEIYMENHRDNDEVIGSIFKVKLPVK